MKPSNTNPQHARPAAHRTPVVLVAATVALLAFIGMLVATVGAGVALGAAKATSGSDLAGSKSSPNDCGLFWRVVPSSNPSTILNFLNSVAAISPDDVWAVGYYIETVGGGQYPRATAQHWDGMSWSVVTVPQPGSATNLNSVSALSSNDIWAVGTEFTSASLNVTFALHWDGSSWTHVPTPNPGGARGSALAGVAAVATDAVWAVGSEGVPTGSQIIVMFWDGTTWSAIPASTVGTTSYFTAVSAASVDDMWAVGVYRETGGYNDQTLAMHCSRSGCMMTTTPDPGVTHNDLWGVSALSSSDVWAVGYSVVMTNPGETLPLVLRWNGLGWSTMPTPPAPAGMDATYLDSVIAISPNDLWGPGNSSSSSTSQSITYAVHWNGSAWTLVTSPNAGSNNSFNAGATLGPGDIWAVGDYQAANPYPYYNLAEHYSDPCVTPSPTPTNVPNPSPSPTSTPPASCSIQFTDVTVGSTLLLVCTLPGLPKHSGRLFNRLLHR